MTETEPSIAQRVLTTLPEDALERVVARFHADAYEDWPVDTEEGDVSRWNVYHVMAALLEEGVTVTSTSELPKVGPRWWVALLVVGSYWCGVVAGFWAWGWVAVAPVLFGLGWWGSARAKRRAVI